MIRRRKFSDKVRGLENIIELEGCPVCRGAGIVTDEGGWSVQVECVDCGAHTVYVEYDSEEEKREAERRVAMLWNIGKVIRHDPGE